MATRLWLPAFNPGWNFVARRKMNLGKDLLPGDAIDKSLLTTRRLRLLYEQRWIEPATSPLPKPKPQQRYAIEGEGSRFFVKLGESTIDGPFPRKKAEAIVHQLNQRFPDVAA